MVRILEICTLIVVGFTALLACAISIAITIAGGDMHDE